MSGPPANHRVSTSEGRRHSAYRGLTVRDLEIVLAVVKFGSMACAARELGIDPAAVCRRIGLVERIVGGTLFRTSQVGCMPTELGTDFAVHARMVIGALDHMVACLAEKTTTDAAEECRAKQDKAARYMTAMLGRDFL